MADGLPVTRVKCQPLSNISNFNKMVPTQTYIFHFDFSFIANTYIFCCLWLTRKEYVWHEAYLNSNEYFLCVKKRTCRNRFCIKFNTFLFNFFFVISTTFLTHQKCYRYFPVSIASYDHKTYTYSKNSHNKKI